MGYTPHPGDLTTYVPTQPYTPHFTVASILSRHYLTHQTHCTPVKEGTGISLIISKHLEAEMFRTQKIFQAAYNKLWKRPRGSRRQWARINTPNCIASAGPSFSSSLWGLSWLEHALEHQPPVLRSRAPFNTPGNAPCSWFCLTYLKTTHQPHAAGLD